MVMWHGRKDGCHSCVSSICWEKKCLPRTPRKPPLPYDWPEIWPHKGSGIGNLLHGTEDTAVPKKLRVCWQGRREWSGPQLVCATEADTLNWYSSQMQVVLSNQSYRSHEKCSDHTLFNGVKLSGLFILPASLFKGLAPSPKSKCF